MFNTPFYLIQVLSIIVSFVGFVYGLLKPEYNLLLTAIIIGAFIIFKKKNQTDKILLKPVHIFLIGFFIVFFQKGLDYVLGYNVPTFDIVNEYVMNVCLILANIGLSSFLLGYSICSKKNISVKNDNYEYASVVGFKVLTTLFIFLFLILTPRSVLMGGYNTGYDGGTTSVTYLMSWVTMFISAHLIQLSVNIKTKHISITTIRDFVKEVGVWQNLNVLAFILIILNIGDRGPVITLVLAYYISYIMATGASPKLRVIIAGLVSAALFFSLLGESKSYRGNDTIFERLSKTLEAREEGRVPESCLEATNELASSFKCLGFSVLEKGTSGDYKYGQYQLNYLLTTIPFISRVIPLAGNSSSEVNDIIYGGRDRTSGVGTSCLADFYLDLGPLGILVGMFIWGFLLCYFEKVLLETENPNLFLCGIAFYFLIHVFYIPRSAVFLCTKYAVWLGLVLNINKTMKKE